MISGKGVTAPRGTNVAVALALIYQYNPSLRAALDIKYCSS